MCGGKNFKTLRWIECRQTGLGQVTANCQPSFCRLKVGLEVRSLVVLVSARWLHCRLLGLLITYLFNQISQSNPPNPAVLD